MRRFDFPIVSFWYYVFDYACGCFRLLDLYFVLTPSLQLIRVVWVCLGFVDFVVYFGLLVCGVLSKLTLCGWAVGGICLFLLILIVVTLFVVAAFGGILFCSFGCWGVVYELLLLLMLVCKGCGYGGFAGFVFPGGLQVCCSEFGCYVKVMVTFCEVVT